MLFYNRLKARGWDISTLEPIFIAAHEKIRPQPQRKKNTKPEPPQTKNKQYCISNIIQMISHAGECVNFGWNTANNFL